MKSTIFVCLAATVLCMIGWSADAHHSRANFDLHTVIEIDGVITEFTWRNPHTYATIDVVNEETGETEEWLIEMQSTAVLRRLGWTADILEPGQRVKILGNPDVDESKRFIYLDDVVTDRGVLWGEPPSSGFTTTAGELGGSGMPPPEVMQRIMADMQTVSQGGASTDFTGTWLTSYGGAMNLHIENVFFDEEKYARPTPLGAEMLANFSHDDDPAYRCIPLSLPNMAQMPFASKYTRETIDGHEVLKIVYGYFNQERLIYLDMEEHPDDIEPSIVGHSIGRFEEDGQVLIVDTVGFAPHPWGNGRGLDGSDQKHVMESFRLVDEGTRIEYTSYTFDPVYLEEPLVRSVQYVYEPGREIEEFECDEEASTRHLSLENDND